MASIFKNFKYYGSIFNYNFNGYDHFYVTNDLYTGGIVVRLRTDETGNISGAYYSYIFNNRPLTSSDIKGFIKCHGIPQGTDIKLINHPPTVCTFFQNRHLE